MTALAELAFASPTDAELATVIYAEGETALAFNDAPEIEVDELEDATTKADNYPDRVRPEQIADYEAWVTAESGSMLSSLAKRFGYENAEDLLQEGQTTVFLKWNMLEEGTDLGAWAWTIVKHTALNRIRSHATEREHRAMLRPEEIDYTLTNAPSNDPSPGQQLLEEIDVDRVHRAVNTLWKPFRDALIEIAMEGKTYEHFAAEHKLPIGTVQSRLFRARRDVRLALEAERSTSDSNTIEGSPNTNTQAITELTRVPIQPTGSPAEAIQTYAQRRIGELREKEPTITVGGIAKALGITTREVRQHDIVTFEEERKRLTVG